MITKTTKATIYNRAQQNHHPQNAGEEYDRLSVAYGLGYWDLGRFLADFESPEIHTDGDDSPRWSDGFISKDMT